jgi:serine/threonine protein kinase
VTEGASGRSFGRYQLLGLLGRGGMGEVFRAYDTSTDRIVAIKLLPPHAGEDREFRERFRREARTAAGLNDPHVVPIHGYGEINGQLYVDMRLIEGRHLLRFMAEHGGRLSPDSAVTVIEQVAAALDSAHRAGLVHRDVKPSNILVANARDFVYLIDFGIARNAADTAMTRSGNALGTFTYMAPERFDGATDPRCDVYSLACVLHECLTGTRPYPGNSLESQLHGHLNTPPPRPSTVVPDLPRALDPVIARGMAKYINARYQTAPELAEAARAAITHRPASPPPPRPQRPAEVLTQQAPAHSAAPQVQSPQPSPKPSSPQPSPQPSSPPARRRSRALLISALGTVALVAVAVCIFAFVLPKQKKGAATAPPSGSESSESTSETTGPGEHTSGASAPPGAPTLPAFAAPANLGANCQYPASTEPASKPVKPPPSGKISTKPAQIPATLNTNHGDIALALANDKSPCTVNSFVSLAKQGFFDNTSCHRLAASAMLGLLQCGDPKSDGSGGPGYAFASEYPTDQYPADDPALSQPVLYPRGTVAMASTGPNTNGSQFYLVYQTSELPPEYTVFGTIGEAGLQVLQTIAHAGVVDGGEDGQPATAVWIQSVRVE